MKRLRLDTLEPRPKAVYLSDSWSDPRGLLANSQIARKVAHIRTCIQNGTPLPTGYYRKGVGLSADTLLQSDGIMHLHLGASNTPELLYLIQYPDHVVLLELSDHDHFATRPVGARLRSKHSVAIARKEKELAAHPVKRDTFLKRRSGPVPKSPKKGPDRRQIEQATGGDHE